MWLSCRPPSSGLQAIPEAAHGDDMARIGSVDFDLGAQAAHMDVDQATVTEVVVAPDLVEQRLAAEHLARILRELAQQTELGLGEVHLVTVAQHLALLRD